MLVQQYLWVNPGYKLDTGPQLFIADKNAAICTMLFDPWKIVWGREYRNHPDFTDEGHWLRSRVTAKLAQVVVAEQRLKHKISWCAAFIFSWIPSQFNMHCAHYMSSFRNVCNFQTFKCKLLEKKIFHIIDQIIWYWHFCRSKMLNISDFAWFSLIIFNYYNGGILMFVTFPYISCIYPTFAHFPLYYLKHWLCQRWLDVTITSIYQKAHEHTIWYL